MTFNFQKYCDLKIHVSSHSSSSKVPPASITPLKQPYCICTIMLSMPSDHRSCHVFPSFCQGLIDLHDAFNTTDYNILISYFSSWFEIHGSVLNRFKSYLSSHSFHVKCDKNFSSEHISYCGVPKGSVLGPLLFVMYTTPLSTLNSLLSLKHHLHADDTQLFSHFILVTLTQVLPNSRQLYDRFPPRCP